jgi:hypothetical protein
MLRRAKAPWQDPHGCRIIADSMMWSLRSPSGCPSPRLRRAQDAIDVLRRLLPTVISHFRDACPEAERLEELAEDPSYDREAEDDWALETGSPGRPRKIVDAFEQLLPLLNSLPRLTLRHPTPWWQLDAARLFEIYTVVVDRSAGISEEGPAVRFLHEALMKMGYPASITHSAIDHALRRRGMDWLDIATKRRLYDP